MEASVAKAIVDVGQEEGLEIELYENYSGRGMFGDRTSGVTCEMRTFMQCVALSMKYAEDEEQDEIIAAMGEIRWDSMGRSESIFY